MRTAWIVLVLGVVLGGWLLLSTPRADVVLRGDTERSVDCRPLALRGQGSHDLLGALDPDQQDLVREHLEGMQDDDSSLTASQSDLFRRDAAAALSRACDQAREERAVGLVLAAVPTTAGLATVLVGASRRRAA